MQHADGDGFAGPGGRLRLSLCLRLVVRLVVGLGLGLGGGFGELFELLLGRVGFVGFVASVVDGFGKRVGGPGRLCGASGVGRRRCRGRPLVEGLHPRGADAASKFSVAAEPHALFGPHRGFDDSVDFHSPGRDGATKGGSPGDPQAAVDFERSVEGTFEEDVAGKPQCSAEVASPVQMQKRGGQG